MPSSTPPRARGRGLGVAGWGDADKVVLVSCLTLPFAIGWVLRTLQVERDPSMSRYVSRDFLPVILPFLWTQAIGHLALIGVGLALRRRPGRRLPWLVHAEVQFWFVCLAFSLYAVGAFTSPIAVLMLVLPVVGYLLFETRTMHYGLVTMTLGAALAIGLPAAGVVPYAPFLAHAPFADGHLEPAWILSFGIPSVFATGVGIAIHTQLVRRLRDRQAELERLSSTDALTELANRGQFFRRLDEEIARARRYQLPLSVLMVDVDHFKAVNDSHGHQIGDLVLRAIGSRLREALRTGDLAARYGGEEFALLLPHTSTAEATQVAERLLGVARTLRVRGGPDTPVTVSIGVAVRTDDEGGEALVARADAALYASKRAGRDRLSVAPA